MIGSAVAQRSFCRPTHHRLRQRLEQTGRDLLESIVEDVSRRQRILVEDRASALRITDVRVHDTEQVHAEGFIV